MASPPQDPPEAHGRAAQARHALVRVARRLIRRYRRARVSTLAAALAYYAAFSLGPLLLLLGGWLGSVLRDRPELAARYREALAQILAPVLPEGVESLDLVQRSFEVVVDQLTQGTLLRGALSVVVLLWAASGFFASLQRALEVIFEVSETRGFLRTRGVAMLLIAGVALVIALELIGGTLATWGWRTLQSATAGLEGVGLSLPGPPAVLTDPGPWRLVLAVAAFAACFRWLPRRTARWDGSLLGATISVAGLELMGVLLPLALDESRFNLVYGVIASLVVLLLWLYLALLLFLLGAVVAAEASAEGRRRARQRERQKRRPAPT